MKLFCGAWRAGRRTATPGRWRLWRCLEPARHGGRYMAAAVAALALAAAGYWGWRWWEARPNTSAEAVAAMRAGAWHRAEGLLRRETTTEARAPLAETLLELDRVEEAKDIVLSLPGTPRVEATKLLAQRRFGEAARAFGALPDGRVDGCRIQGKTEPEQALLCWDGVLRETPNNGPAWLQSGLVLARQRKVAPALERLGRAETIFRAAGEVEGIAEARLGRAAADSAIVDWAVWAERRGAIAGVCVGEPGGGGVPGGETGGAGAGAGTEHGAEEGGGGGVGAGGRRWRSGSGTRRGMRWRGARWAGVWDGRRRWGWRGSWTYGRRCWGGVWGWMGSGRGSGRSWNEN